MLEAFQRASKKGAVSMQNAKPFPVKLDVIEKYMQILQPAFEFNAFMQYTKSSIAVVVPNVLTLISKWERMKVTNTYRRLCDLLILGFKRKFDYELNSPIYSVASLFNVSNWSAWLNRSYCVKMRKQAFDSIVQVAISFLKEKTQEENVISSSPTPGGLSNSSSYASINFIHNESYESETAITRASMEIDLEKERIEFVSLVENANILDKKFRSTSNFWKDNKNKFPILFKLALILYNILASSAFIERFYSLSGNVCKNRDGNMNSETIIARTMLKANMEILKSLTTKQFNNYDYGDN